MQVQCSKCSELLALSDAIESSDGRLSHMNCKSPRTLTVEERALLSNYCSGHVVAYCLGCDLRFRLAELVTDPLGGRTNLCCTRCRRDLTQSARGHVYGCVMVPVEVRLTANAVREAAQHLVKEGQQLPDASGRLIRKAEGALVAKQRALREVMSRRTAPSLRRPAS